MYIFHSRKTEIPPADLDGIAEDFESFLVRRMVCGLPTKNYNNLFLSLLSSLKETEQIDRQVVRDLLLKSKADASIWPDDQAFEQSWLTRDVYHGMGYRAKLVLEAIDLQMMTSKQEQVHLSGVLTLEHIMPQGWQEKDYPMPPAEDEKTRLAQSERRLMLLQTFGNLTLLTQALNSSISNGPFLDKQTEIRTQGLLRINGEFLNARTANTWTEDDIHERGTALFDIAKKIWIYPE